MGTGIGVVILIAVIIVLSGLKVYNEYERGVIFRLGRLTPYRGPGVIFVILVHLKFPPLSHDNSGG